MEQQEKKVIADIKKMAKAGQMVSVWRLYDLTISQCIPYQFIVRRCKCEIEVRKVLLDTIIIFQDGDVIFTHFEPHSQRSDFSAKSLGHVMFWLAETAQDAVIRIALDLLPVLSRTC